MLTIYFINTLKFIYNAVINVILFYFLLICFYFDAYLVDKFYILPWVVYIACKIFELFIFFVLGRFLLFQTRNKITDFFSVMSIYFCYIIYLYLIVKGYVLNDSFLAQMVFQIPRAFGYYRFGMDIFSGTLYTIPPFICSFVGLLIKRKKVRQGTSKTGDGNT